MIDDVEDTRCACCGEDAGSFFDREICAYPCDMVHYRCRECGAPLDYCKLEDEK